MSSSNIVIKSLLARDSKYRQLSCFDVCLQREVIKNCKCQDPGNPFLLEQNVTNLCLSLYEQNCNFATYAEFYKKNVAEKCSDVCPKECKSVVYTLTFSTSSYPTRAYYENLAMQSKILSKFNGVKPSYEELKSRMASVAVYYDELGYTRIVETEKVLLIDLISSVGGQLGLFVGISFLSCAEIFDLMVNLIFIFIKHSCRKESINE
jgi:hypothetical protein